MIVAQLPTKFIELIKIVAVNTTVSVALREENITEFEEVKFIKHDRIFKIRDFEPEIDCVGGLSKSCLQLRILASPSMIKELQISVSRQSGSGILLIVKSKT